MALSHTRSKGWWSLKLLIGCAVALAMLPVGQLALGVPSNDAVEASMLSATRLAETHHEWSCTECSREMIWVRASYTNAIERGLGLDRTPTDGDALFEEGLLIGIGETGWSGGGGTKCPDTAEPTECGNGRATTCGNGIETQCGNGEPTKCGNGTPTHCGNGAPTTCENGLSTSCQTATACPVMETHCPQGGTDPTDCPKGGTDCATEAPTKCVYGTMSTCTNGAGQTQCDPGEGKTTACGKGAPTSCGNGAPSNCGNSSGKGGPTNCADGQSTSCANGKPTECENSKDPTQCGKGEPTQCDNGPATKCGTEPTTCPKAPTDCPQLITECPPISTFCPEEHTKCPATPTECVPDVLSICIVCGESHKEDGRFGLVALGSESAGTRHSVVGHPGVLTRIPDPARFEW